MSEIIRLVVAGKPEPRGSKIAVPLYDKIKDAAGNVVIDPATGFDFKPRVDARGRVMTFMRDDNSASGPWMKKVALAAKLVMGGRRPIDAPIVLTLDFYLERPLYHFGTGRNSGVLKDRHRNAKHTVRPDRLKLARAVEDALSEIAYFDDAQTIDGPVRKHYVAPGEEPRCEITIEILANGDAASQLSLIDQFKMADSGVST